MVANFNIDKTYQYLLILLAFLMPLTVFGANLVIVIICSIWLFSGGYKDKFLEIIKSKYLLASVAFFSIHLIGLIWTENLEWGLHILHKMWYFLLLLPILHTIVHKKYIKYYLFSFLLAIFITEVISYLVWFELIHPFKNATVENPTPFMSHISYNPILCFAIYLVLYQTFLIQTTSRIKFFFYSLFSITMIFNMFITGGRAGQVMFFSMLVILIFQFFDNSRIKPLFLAILIIPVTFFLAYQSSDLFKLRVNETITNINNYSINQTSSIGQRITFTINSWEMIQKNPLIGVGTGDFPDEYKKINLVNSKHVNTTSNPHNMYILVSAQLGLIGLLSFLSIFYYQIKFALNSNSKLVRDIGVTLPLLFLIIMWSDSYLLGHYTSLMFVFFSSFLYKDFEKI